MNEIKANKCLFLLIAVGIVGTIIIVLMTLNYFTQISETNTVTNDSNINFGASYKPTEAIVSKTEDTYPLATNINNDFIGKILHPSIQKECAKHIDILGDENFPQDTLVTFDYMVDRQASFYSLNTSPDPIQRINNLMTISTSLDNNHYAYQDFSNGSIWIYASTGILVKKITEVTPNLQLEDWLGSEKIVLRHNIREEGDRYSKYPADIDILNITTGQTITKSADYPDIDRTTPSIRWADYTTIYNPKLTEVVYPGGIEKDFYGNKGVGYILRNMENDQNELSIATGGFSFPPKWSNSGEKLLVPRIDMGLFFLVLNHGKEVLDIQSSVEQGFYTNVFSWSPDEKTVAVWIEPVSKEQNNASLAIYELGTNRIIDFCIPAGTFDAGIVNEFEPKWSSDGNYLATISNWHHYGTYATFDVIVIDLVSKNYYKVGENEFPVGWLRATN